MTVYFLWFAVAITVTVASSLLRRRGLITSRQEASWDLVADAFWGFGAVVSFRWVLPCVVLSAALDLRRWHKARDDDDDQDKKRRLRSKARSHLPRPVVRGARPVEVRP